MSLALANGQSTLLFQGLPGSTFCREVKGLKMGYPNVDGWIDTRTFVATIAVSPQYGSGISDFLHIAVAKHLLFIYTMFNAAVTG
jgi:hypothetical protein